MICMCQVADAYSLIGKGLFKKETDMSVFVGLRVKTDDGDTHADAVSSL